MVIKGLSKINKNIKMQNIDKDKKEEIVNWLGIVKLSYPKNSKILNLIYSIARKLKIEKEVKNFHL
jgi:hypothetical protein